MPNPQRFRINDVTGKCFDAFVLTAQSDIENKMFLNMVRLMNSVRPLSSASSVYAGMLLQAAGFRPELDFEVEQVGGPNDGHTDSGPSSHRG